MKRLILFLIRLKLGVEKGEQFKIVNQIYDDKHFVMSDGVFTIEKRSDRVRVVYSDIPLNVLLDCKIELVRKA